MADEMTMANIGTDLDLAKQREKISQIMKKELRDGVDYGVIPGVNKPSLFKSGSEKLLSTFHIGIKPEVIDLSTDDEIKYQINALAFYWPTGASLGQGVGCASSNEKKYKWRKAVSPAEYDATPEDRRQIAYYRDGTQQQVRTNPADCANTILKMAKKRAQIDVTLTILAVSDMFTQDVEDMDIAPQGGAGAKPAGETVKIETNKVYQLNELKGKNIPMGALFDLVGYVTEMEEKKVESQKDKTKGQIFTVATYFVGSDPAAAKEDCKAVQSFDIPTGLDYSKPVVFRGTSLTNYGIQAKKVEQAPEPEAQNGAEPTK